MPVLRIVWTAALAISSGMAYAQQLSGSSMNIDWPGLSSSCQSALNTTVECPVFLSGLSMSHAILDNETVKALCVDSCYSSLDSARSKIKSACTTTSDVIVYNQITYPASFVVDNFLHAYDVSCKKDSKSGTFCDPQILEWSKLPTLTSAQICSDCWLGMQAVQLNSPLGYDEGLASSFASLTSSCSASGYGIAAPTAYAISTATIAETTTIPSPSVASCTNTYTVKDTDDCHSVAKAFSVSTYDLLNLNNMDLYCQNFNTAIGKNLCIPAKCNTYTWQAYDSCESVASNHTGVTVTQFLSWNPGFNSLCQNSLKFWNYEVCISPPGGYLNTTTNSNQEPAGSATTAAPVPTNAKDESNRHCGRWHTVREYDTCALVSTANFLSLAHFYFLNPSLDSNCSNLLLGLAYCVQPVGSIFTYSGFPTELAPFFTVPAATWSYLNATSTVPNTRQDVATTAVTPAPAVATTNSQVHSVALSLKPALS